MFRAIHADGIFGGVTPSENIHMSFWSERNPIPQLIEYQINQDGTLGDEVTGSRIGKTGLVREVDVDVIMDLGTAIALRKWLDEKISILQTAVSQNQTRKN